MHGGGGMLNRDYGKRKQMQASCVDNSPKQFLL